MGIYSTTLTPRRPKSWKRRLRKCGSVSVETLPCFLDISGGNGADATPRVKHCQFSDHEVCHAWSNLSELRVKEVGHPIIISAHTTGNDSFRHRTIVAIGPAPAYVLVRANEHEAAPVHPFVLWTVKAQNLQRYTKVCSSIYQSGTRMCTRANQCKPRS